MAYPKRNTVQKTGPGPVMWSRMDHAFIILSQRDRTTTTRGSALPDRQPTGSSSSTSSRIGGGRIFATAGTDRHKITFHISQLPTRAYLAGSGMGIGEVEGCGGAMDAYRRAMGVMELYVMCWVFQAARSLVFSIPVDEGGAGKWAAFQAEPQP